MAVISDDAYDRLLNQIGSTLTQGRGRAIQAVNVHLMETYWQVGQQIVEFEQGGHAKAEYGAGLITRLSQDLKTRHGKGFDRSDLIRMRQFYLAYPKGATVSHFLSWSQLGKRYGKLIRDNGRIQQTIQKDFRGTMILLHALATSIPFLNSQLSILHSQLSRGFAW